MFRSAPTIPETPSSAINSALHSHFSEASSNVCHNAVGHVVCNFFQAANRILSLLARRIEGQSTKTLWSASCGLVAVVVMIAVWLLYSTVVSMSFVFHALLYYAAILIGLGAGALGIAGVVFFEKVPSRPAKTTEPSSTTAGGYEGQRNLSD